MVNPRTANLYIVCFLDRLQRRVFTLTIYCTRNRKSFELFIGSGGSSILDSLLYLYEIVGKGTKFQYDHFGLGFDFLCILMDRGFRRRYRGDRQRCGESFSRRFCDRTRLRLLDPWSSAREHHRFINGIVLYSSNVLCVRSDLVGSTIEYKFLDRQSIFGVWFNCLLVLNQRG